MVSESFDRNVRDDAVFNMANMASFDHISHHPLHPNQKITHAKIVVTRTNKKTFVTHSDIQLCVQTRVVYKSMLNLLTLLDEDFFDTKSQLNSKFNACSIRIVLELEYSRALIWMIAESPGFLFLICK